MVATSQDRLAVYNRVRHQRPREPLGICNGNTEVHETLGFMVDGQLPLEVREPR